MFGSDLKQLIVLDEIRDKLEMIDSDIIPETETHPVVTGIENVPTSIVSSDGVSYQSTYTTFPLSPLQGRVHYIKDSFLNFSIDVSFTIFINKNISSPIYLYVGPRDSSSIFNQLQLMIDNNVIWNTTYHQIESALDLAGLPASVVDHSNNYATIDKLLHSKDTPMKLITIPAANYASLFFTDATRSQCYLNYNLEYNFTIDLNRLCVPLSNIDFITSNMGNLRLRVYLNNFHESFYYFQIPSGIVSQMTANDTLTLGTAKTITLNDLFSVNALIAINPIKWGSIQTSQSGSQWIATFSEATFISDSVLNSSSFSATGTASQLTIGKTIGTAKTDYNTLTSNETLIPIQFIKRGQNQQNNFMKVNIAEICQTCFDIEEQSWNKLCEYFGSVGKVILPIQSWSTNLFNNGTFEAGNTIDSTLLANVPGNNITDIAVTMCPSNNQSCILNPYLSNIQALLDGKPLNVVPYNKIDNRAIQDFTNACVDTDYEEINTDYLYSLQFPPLITEGSYSNQNKSRSNQEYFYNIGNETDFTYFGKMKSKIGLSERYIKNPNLFMYVFQTAIPSSFHTGMCIIENTNRQALFRLTSSGTAGIFANLNQRFYPVRSIQSTVTNAGANETTTLAYTFPSMPNSTNTNVQFNISCLCDECIVLDYDSVLNTCTGGYISYAKPFLSE